jgi:hypothetical protein
VEVGGQHAALACVIVGQTVAVIIGRRAAQRQQLGGIVRLKVVQLRLERGEALVEVALIGLQIVLGRLCARKQAFAQAPEIAVGLQRDIDIFIAERVELVAQRLSLLNQPLEVVEDAPAAAAQEISGTLAARQRYCLEVLADEAVAQHLQGALVVAEQAPALGDLDQRCDQLLAGGVKGLELALGEMIGKGRSITKVGVERVEQLVECQLILAPRPLQGLDLASDQLLRIAAGAEGSTLHVDQELVAEHQMDVGDLAGGFAHPDQAQVMRPVVLAVMAFYNGAVGIFLQLVHERQSQRGRQTCQTGEARPRVDDRVANVGRITGVLAQIASGNTALLLHRGQRAPERALALRI